MDENPYSPPEAAVRDSASPPDNLLRLVGAYRGLVLWFGLQLLIGIGGAVAIASVGPDIQQVVVLVRSLGLIVTVIGLAVYAYRTAQALGSNVSVLWSLAMIVPLVNVITLLVLSSKATRACRAAGIPVGFLGPKQPPTTKRIS